MPRILRRHLPVRAARLALVLLVLCAFGAQQWVAQTHWHGPVVSQVGPEAPPADDGGHSRDHDCLLCQIAAHAGAAAPPAAVLLVLRPSGAFDLPRIGSVADVPSPPGHAWQSRGPPTA